jgi:hypothetical protein
MLFGFELFARLRRDLRAEVIEVYPFAIVRELLFRHSPRRSPTFFREEPQ